MTLRKLLPICTLFSITLFTGCDIVKNDNPVNPLRAVTATLFATPGKPSVIDLATVSDGLNLSATGNASPRYGSVENLLQGKYLAYTPSTSLSGKDEVLLFPLSDQTNSTIGNLKLTVKALDSDTNCNCVVGVADYASIKSDSTLVIDLLANDVFSGVSYNGGILSQQPLEGATLDDYSINLRETREVKLIYTPQPGFTGKVRILYSLGINWLPGTDRDSRTSDEILADPTKYLQAFMTAIVEIDVH